MARTRRRLYSGSKRHDKTCRNHGSCAWCRSNRTANAKRREMAAMLEEKGDG